MDLPPTSLPSASADFRTLTPDVSKQLQPKRNRVQLSCTHCRHAKLRCDREEPCSQCTKRGRASQCTFPAPAPRKKPVVSMQNRLKHLENLVKDVMTGQTLGSIETGSSSTSEINRGMSEGSDPQQDLQFPHQQRKNPDSAASILSKSTATGRHASGSVVEGTNATTYVGATHWAAILDDVSIALLSRTW